MEQKSIRRDMLLFYGFSFICFLLLIRLFYVQIIKNDFYTQKAVNQRMVSITVGSGRGTIYDRNLIPFIERDIDTTIIVYPQYIYEKDTICKIISKCCNLEISDVLTKLENNKNMIEFSVVDKSSKYLDLIRASKVKGIMLIEKKRRYSIDGLARHIIGKLSSDNCGESGIEKKLDEYLKGSSEESIVSIVDSSKTKIPGLGIRKIEGESFDVILTLDYHIQNIVEEIMDTNNINGAVVVMDVESGDILAMASRPNIKQSTEQLINGESIDYLNKCVCAYNLGSVFKTIVAAAALESDKVDLDALYKCEGSIQLGDTIINCSTYETHKNREIDIKEAFALSCNTTFIKIGQMIGAKDIIDMSKRFGFGTTLSTIRENKESINILNEASGNLPSTNDGISNISIGQGSLLATPLQVTCMMNTIANNGIMYYPRIIDSIVTKNGHTVEKFDIAKPDIVISRNTASMLKDMLYEVTKEGTGKAANIDRIGGCLAKTGSAEAGDKTHAWFAGFFPKKNPKYSMTVFVYDGKSGGANAAPIFSQIANKIY